jgi:hypothetical protein
MTKVQEECLVMIKTRTKTPTAISITNMYLINEPQTIEMSCKSQARHIAVAETEYLTLEQRCQLVTANHIIYAGQSVMQLENAHKWLMNWDAKALCDLNANEIDN